MLFDQQHRLRTRAPGLVEQDRLLQRDCRLGLAALGHQRGDLHGARANRALNALLEPGHDACVCVTHVDALVLARSAFHLVVEQVVPGRWKDVRWPSAEEFKQTLVVKLPIREGSAKVRALGVIDDEADLAQGCWAGLLPVQTVFGPAQRDPLLPADIPLPGYAERYGRPSR
jgi:uncharacterized protein